MKPPTLYLLSAEFIESQTGLGQKVPLQIIQVQPLCCGQGHLSLDQGAQSPLQPDCEQFSSLLSACIRDRSYTHVSSSLYFDFCSSEKNLQMKTGTWLTKPKID